MSFATVTAFITGTEPFTGFDVIPSPMFIAGNWWSFCDSANGIPIGEVIATTTVLQSQQSLDDALTFTVENLTTGSFNQNVSVSGNNLLLAKTDNSSTYLYKDISSSGNDWVRVNQTTLPGGAIGGSYNDISFNASNNTFTLIKGLGRDIYTSTDLVTWTPVNGATDNTLSTLIDAFRVDYVGSQFVAIGQDKANSNLHAVATSTDLLNWTLIPGNIPTFFDIRYFESAYLGITLVGANPSSRVLQIWRSTDLITWTQQTLPGATFGSSFDGVWVGGGRYEVLSSTQLFTTTNGTTFTSTELKYNLQGLSASNVRSFAFVRGKQHKMSTSAPPSRVLMRTVNHRQFGGKVIEWTSGVNGVPAGRFPPGANADVGFIGLSALGGQGIKTDGFTLVNDNYAEGFYLHRTDIRYFEVKILSTSVGAAGKFGIHAPADDHFSGLNTTLVQLTDNQVETSAGNLPVTYTVTAGQILGFVVNFITAQVEIRVDNIVLTTIPNLATSIRWTQLFDCTNCEARLNIGQEAFEHSVSGTVAWNS